MIRSRLHRSGLRLLGATLVVAMVGLAPSGCNILGPLHYFVVGTPMIPPEYELQPRPTVVFVDDRSNVISTNARVLRLAIADKITEDLMVKKVLTPEQMISPRDALAIVRAQDRADEPLPIDAIGRLVGAEQIIYVQMLQFGGSSDGMTMQPSAGIQVRVIDVPNRMRVYPVSETETARRVAVKMPPIDPAHFNSPTTRLALYQQLAEMLGARVAEMFYEHDSRDLGGNINSHGQ